MKKLMSLILSVVLAMSACAMMGIQAADTQNDLKEEGDGEPVTIKVLILGNSITQHGPNESIGWLNNYGMAASSQENDYVHRLMDGYVAEKYDNVEYKIGAAYPVESTIIVDEEYDYTEKFAPVVKEVIDFQPDIILLQMGENVNVQGLTTKAYLHAMHQLLDSFQKEKPGVKVILSIPFWGGSVKTETVKTLSEEYGYPYADISKLNTNENKATGKFENAGVASHPGDKGMESIAKAYFELMDPMLAELSKGLSTSTSTAEDIIFEKTKTYANNFSDLNEQDWFYQNVVSAFELGFMNGVDDSTFDPNGNVTVAQGITLAARLHQIYHGSDEIKPVSTGDWYTPYVDYAIKNSIMENGQFDQLDRALTRAEMAVLFVNALPEQVYKGIHTAVSIPDVKQTDSCFHAVFTLYRAGIINGSDADGTFYPNREITRAEISAVLTRIAEPTLRM